MSAATTVIDAAQKAQNFANQTVETARFEVLKEPLGFIKILQFIMALLAFSIAVNGSSTTYFYVTCVAPSGTGTSTTTASTYGAVLFKGDFGYPYDLRNSNLQQMGSCQSGGSVPAFGTQTTITLASTNIVSSAQFFVFTGVTAFLYSLFMGVVYVFFRQKYSNMVFFSLIDFGVTCIFAIFWFAGSIAWAKAINDIQYYSNPDNIISALNPPCTGNNCQSAGYPGYANIIVSCIIGFGNIILWCGDVWFVFKETAWYRTRQEVQRQAQNVTNNPISPNDVNITASYNPNNRI